MNKTLVPNVTNPRPNPIDPESHPSLSPHQESKGIIPNLIPTIPPIYPLNPPTVEPTLEHLSFLERSTEVLRYTLLSLEYSLSPKGRLRQWIKLNILLFLWLGIPLLLFTPLVTYFLGQFVTMTGYINESILNLLNSILPTFILVTILSVIIYFCKRKSS
jgi:hypothetical protein